jgi:hypothetical protein
MKHWKYGNAGWILFSSVDPTLVDAAADDF